jgi:hypothetical protein
MVIFASTAVAVAAVQLLAWRALSGRPRRSRILDGLSSDHPDSQPISSLAYIMKSEAFFYHADRASYTLVRFLFEERMTAAAAVKETML